MSGGVDSSVSAGILKEQGYDVVGVHMRCYNVDGCAEQDAEDARRAAETLNIPFYVFDFEQAYKDRVVKYMVDGYKKGITPNPDVMCNKEIKFGLFFDKAMAMGADYVATGHYVRKQATSDKRQVLRVAKDGAKDQSYFLWTLKPEQIKKSLFPVGNLIKRTQVRKLAKQYGLPNAEKKDSQGICFLGQVTLTDFLKQYIPEKRGLVLSTAGKTLGEHKGAHYYTIGQRHGLNLSDKRQATSDKGYTKPYYVSAKDMKKNTVTVAEGDENEALYQKEIKLTAVNFIGDKKQVTSNKVVYARVRYRQSVQKAVIANLSLVSGRLSLKFDRPVKFVAVGQSAVFYAKSGEMLGGGIIK